MIFNATIAQIVFSIVMAYNIPEAPKISLETNLNGNNTIEYRQCYDYSIDETKEVAKTKSYEIWDYDYWYYIERIIHKESSWNCQAKNPKSSAYGLGQLIKYQRDKYKIKDENNLDEQLNACFLYIKDRYSNPQKAYDFMLRNGYY